MRGGMRVKSFLMRGSLERARSFLTLISDLLPFRHPTPPQCRQTQGPAVKSKRPLKGRQSMVLVFRALGQWGCRGNAETGADTLCK